MVMTAQRLGSPQVVVFVAVGWMLFASAGTCTGASQQSLDWSIHPSKDAYHPGEPVRLMLTVNNRGYQQEDVHFEDDLEVSSMEVRNLSGEVVTKGSTMNRPEGGPRPPLLQIPPGQTSDRSVVLNRWCSTLLLPMGTYEVVCHIKFRLGSEFRVVGQRGTVTEYEASSVHTISLKLNVHISNMDPRKFKDVLEGLRKQAFQTGYSEKEPTWQERQTVREMLALTESTLAVPYQLEVLASPGSGHQARRDAIHSLARSKTIEATVALTGLAGKRGFEGTRWDLVEAVYKIRESGQPEIIAATDDFIQKHKRYPLLSRQIERDVSN